MLRFLLPMLVFLYVHHSLAQTPHGQVIVDSIYSPNLLNEFGEKTTRSVSVYLPPGYSDSEQRYPVIYFLHGFTGNHYLWPEMVDILDFAIASHRIRPFIFIVSDQKTTYDGSFYSNSGVFGNWEDFTAFDLVKYMDENYRTIPEADSRGITGHS
ncbi:MAG: esterase family protein, partial [Saprospiraceae bacterium]|nr:esterase family protein [Saprospiraceae bacterium]